ncbi:MAG: hypothetical protein ACTSVU_00180 [Promethearchaeota archaeon]
MSKKTVSTKKKAASKSKTVKKKRERTEGKSTTWDEIKEGIQEEAQEEETENEEDTEEEKSVKGKDEEESEFVEEIKNLKEIDVSNFFNYQKAISSLLDYLNYAIDDTISEFTRSDQLLFTHSKKKLIMNALLESGFYDFCKYRLSLVTQSNAVQDEKKFIKTMNLVQGEMDLLAYLLVNTRLAHRNLNFDLFLSLLKGGLFVDIMETHEKIVKDLHEREESVNKTSIKKAVRVGEDQLYI